MAVSLDELHDAYFQLGDNVESAVRFTSFYIDDAAISYIVDWCCRQYPVPQQLHSSLSFEDLFSQDDAGAWTVDARAVDHHTVAYGANVTKTVSEDLWAEASASRAHQQDEDYALWLRMQQYYREEKKPSQNGLFRFCFSNQEAPTSGKAFYRNQATIERGSLGQYSSLLADALSLNASTLIPALFALDLAAAPKRKDG